MSVTNWLVFQDRRYNRNEWSHYFKDKYVMFISILLESWKVAYLAENYSKTNLRQKELLQHFLALPKLQFSNA